MANEQQNIKKTLNPKSVIIPLLIGGAVASYFLYQNRVELFSIDWSSKKLIFWLVIAVIIMAMRDVFYMWRLRMLTDKKLSWWKCFEVIVLWEFSSAVTPTMIGGTAVALYLLKKEQFSIGKSTTIVLVSSFLDELFFVIMVPLLFFGIGFVDLFGFIETSTFAEILGGNKLFSFFFLGYFIILIYTLFIGFGVIVHPILIKRILMSIFSLPLLNRWKPNMNQITNDIILASEEVRDKSTNWWFKTFSATALSWSARYISVNCLIMAFFALDQHFLLYGRQLVMWVVLMVTPTPGASGVAELMFSSILSDITHIELSELLALFWRFIAYYPYLILGVVILPRWYKRVSENK